MTTYQQARQYLKEIAQEVKRNVPHDKPAQRQTINDSADLICRDLNLSEAKRNQLANYACKLHPKN